MTQSDQEKFYQLLGERIKIARKKAGLKQDAFAACVGLSRVSIVNIEKGRQHPQIHLLWDIANTLKIEVSELLPVFGSSEKVSAVLEQIIDSRLKESKALKQVKVDKKTEKIIKGFIKELSS